MTFWELFLAWAYTVMIMWPIFILVGLACKYVKPIAIGSVHVTWMIILSLLVIWKWGKSVHRSYFFVIWLTLVGLTFYYFTTGVLMSHQSDMAKQALALMNQEFRPEDTHFWKEFKDIENAEDFYMFLKGNESDSF